MDKLKPILQHRFWILLGLAIPLGLWGYYSANGAMKDATTKRQEELDKLQIPSGNEANPRYAEGLKVINDGYEKSVKTEQRRLWTGQKARMDWPASMESYLPAKYRDDFTNNIRAAGNYRGEYESNNRGELGSLFKDLYERLDPVTRTETHGFKGRVFVDPRIIPRHTFGQFTINKDKIWDAQEDIWFLRVLFDAVRNLNKDAENVATAPLRMITDLKLKGGDGQSTAVRTAAAGGGFGGGSSEMSESYAEMMSDYTESEDRGDGGFGTRVGGGKVGFEPSEEFGSDAKAVAAATSTDSASSVGTFGDVYGGMGARAKELLRYVEFEKYPDFRQRGFYLGVIIDQQKVADFLVELSNAPWPIRIVRFQVGPNPRSTGPRMSPSRFGGPLAFGGMGGAGYLAGSDTAEYESSSIYQDYAGAGSYPESSAEYAPDDSAGLYPGAGSTYPGATYPGGGYPGAGAGPGGASDPLAKTLDHPDLVQLYVCGVITFYNPPAEEAAPASAEPPTEQVVPTETISETPTETPADAGTPAEGATAPASDTPADPAAPTQPAAPVDPPAAPTDAAPPTPPATGDRPAPNATEPGAGSATGT